MQVYSGECIQLHFIFLPDPLQSTIGSRLPSYRVMQKLLRSIALLFAQIVRHEVAFSFHWPLVPAWMFFGPQMLQIIRRRRRY